jgi:hypothetical protein
MDIVWWERRNLALAVQRQQVRIICQHNILKESYNRERASLSVRLEGGKKARDENLASRVQVLKASPPTTPSQSETYRAKQASASEPFHSKTNRGQKN